MIGHTLNFFVDRRQTVAFRETDPWKTSQIVEFANIMMDSKDFSGSPVLANLLEEAGFNNDEVLKLLRATNNTRYEKWSVLEEIAKLAGGEYEEAVNTIYNVGLSFEKVMDDITEYGLNDDYLNEGERYEGICVGNEEWAAYDLLTGNEPPETGYRSSVYTCSC